MAHGYYKAEGKPLAVMAHGTVGLQHAAMALYNAWCDRVPVYLIIGNHGDAALRRGAEWYHGVQDAALMVRDYTKWDDTPWSLAHFAESAVRAYKIALTPPMAPVVLVLDGHLQEEPVSKAAPLAIPKLTLPVPPQGESGAVEEVARLLVEAENPVLVADRLARTQNGMSLLIELAELLQAGVIDQGSRMNFPSRHPLNQSQRAAAAIADADMIVGFELADFWSTVNTLRDQLHRSQRRVARPNTKLVSITTGDLYIRANYQDFRRMQEVDIAIAADGEATLPSLIEAVRRLANSGPAAHVRGTRREARAGQPRGGRGVARRGVVRVRREPREHRALVRGDLGADQERGLVARLELLQRRGRLAAQALGFHEAVSVARRRGRRRHRLRRAGFGRRRAREPRAGRLSVAIQTDGDLMYAPGVLWTAAHHGIPLLSVMNNNRAYHQELMHVQRMCNARNRGVDRGRIGSEITDPNIDYAKMASGLGVHAEGPITEPKELGPALQRAIAVVKKRRARADRRRDAGALSMGAGVRAGVLLVAFAAAAHAPRVAAQASGGADARAAAFAQSGCGVCHGADGAGTTAGPHLAAGRLTLAEFTAAVRRGQRTMPAYSAQSLSDERLAEIYAYLQSQRAPDVPTGRAESGARLFAAYGCYSCHGNEAQGGAAGPRLGPAPITFARFEWYVRHPSQQMPPYSAVIVSDQDVADIYAFVESRPKPPPLDSISVLAP